ncbi:MAG TPA: VIT and VWA domain-containing protein [Polyangia bacterium]|nr:VIT and VWA domain-containing protein [Polyangia bacterium]
MVGVLALVGLLACVDRAAGAAGDPSGKVVAKSPSAVLKGLHNTGGVGFANSPSDRADPADDRTLAPYFYVAGGNPETERLPLKETRAEVDIAGVIAAVRVHQVFENSAGRPIEAVYVFPASTRAAVHAMRMKIGARTIEAHIARKQEARAEYEAAKRAGQRASLLEQERPNVFTTSVANIMPGDRIEVELDYSEMILPENATYEFVYPTVVGPRYPGGANPKTDRWMANPHLSEGEKEPYAFGIKVHMQTGIALKEVSSPSHKIAVSYAGPTTADVRLDRAGGGNKDFVLRYRLAGDKIETGLLLYQEPTAGLDRPGEKFFALLMEPPRRPSEADIPPREYIFLLDVSGSMHGFPLDTTKALMRELLSRLRPTDHFNLALFSGANYVWSPSGSKPANEKNIRDGLDVILRQSGGGGTELMGGMQAAYAIPSLGRGTSRTVVVVTDGYVGVEAQAFRFIRERLDQANLFAFGIGSSVNRALIEGMARAGLGEPFVVSRPEKAAAQAEKLRHTIERPVLTDIQVRMQGFDAYDVAPEKVPDLLAERPLLLFGKYKGDRPGKIEITGRSGRGRFAHSIDLRPADARRENAALRALWARKWVEILEDELHMGGGQEVEDTITGLGLGYSLLTPFTSFVAVDSQVVNRAGQWETVRQPLPMPEGVSNLAVGSSGAGQALGGIAYSHAAGAPAAEPLRAAKKTESRQMYAPKPVSAAPSAPTSELASGKGGRVDSLADSAEAEGKTSKDKKAPVCSVKVTPGKSQSLGDSKALLAIIRRVAQQQGCAQAKPGSTLRLRITVDGAGKITKAERLAGDTAVATAIANKLTGESSATLAKAAHAGTLEVTIGF